MATANGMIEILDPTAEDVPEELGLSETLPSLKGKVVGLLENRKYHADAFLGELKKILLEDYDAAKVVYATKFTYSAPCAEDTLRSLVEDCDAIIHAIADWGSCTAWGLHDAVVTESKGVPSVSVITSTFIRAAHARATALGMPGTRIVVLPSPLAPRTVPEVQQMAQDFAPKIVGLLTEK